jgi:TatD DNase family protein
VVDTHCHLDSCKPDDSELIEHARANGITRLATVGMNDASIDRAIAAAETYDEVYAIVGRHPNEATGWVDTDLEPIERAAGHDRVRAIGETGLDYYRDYAPADDQRRAFEAQIDLAARTSLPLVIHTRAAEEDTFAMLADRARDVTVIMHCFSAPTRLDECVEHGYYCSFAGNVTYPKATDLQDAARAVPDELLLVETDSPYLSPQAVRGQRNEPANVRLTAEFVAELRGLSYDDFDALVERNAARVFGW